MLNVHLFVISSIGNDRNWPVPVIAGLERIRNPSRLEWQVFPETRTFSRGIYNQSLKRGNRPRVIMFRHPIDEV
jgi:hypothetical protein